MDSGLLTAAFEVLHLLEHGLRNMDCKALADPVEDAQGMQIDDHICIK
jgi:hypothetical protein